MLRLVVQSSALLIRWSQVRILYVLPKPSSKSGTYRDLSAFLFRKSIKVNSFILFKANRTTKSDAVFSLSNAKKILAIPTPIHTIQTLINNLLR